MAKVRVYEADVSDVIGRTFSPLLAAQGVSVRAQARITRQLRPALKQALEDTVTDAFRDGGVFRTGKGFRETLSGVRSFGTKFSNLRGYILGPPYIYAHEKGSTIRATKARALAIPLAPALRPDGSPKLPGPRSWQNIQKTFIYKSKKTGKAYIAMKNGRSMTLLYALVDEITLSKYTGFISKSWDKNTGVLLEAMGVAMLFEMDQVDFIKLARLAPRYSSKKGGR